MDNRGVIWARVSSEEQKGGYSLDAQERLLTDFASAKDINVVRTFRVAESASTSTKRKEFKACLSFVEKERIPFLIAEKVDRVTRNLHDLARIYELMTKGLTVSFVREGMNVDEASDPSVHLTFNIIASVAAYIAKNIGREARKGMKEKVEQGGTPFKCPVGYLPVPDPSDPQGKRRTVIVDPERAPLILWSFREYAKGRYSAETLVRELNRKGLTTRPDPKNPARPITRPTLSKILINPYYYGDVNWSGDTYEGKHTPLITKQLFDQVQVRLAEKTTYAHPASKKWFPFKGFLRCGYCGMSITAEEQQGKGGKGRWVYYHCSDGRKVKDPDWYQKKFGQKRCIQPYLKQVDVDEMISKELGEIIINEKMAAEMRRRLKQSRVERTSDEARELQRLLSEQTKQKNRIDGWMDALGDRTMSKEEYNKKKAAAEATVASLQIEIDRLRQVNDKYREQGAQVIELMSGFKKLYEAADLDGKARYLNVVLDKIILKGDDTWFAWSPPFDTLFAIGPLINSEIKGE